MDDQGTLKPALAELYRERGVVTVRGLLTAAEVEEVRRELARYEQTVVPSLGPADVVFEPDGNSVRNLWRMEAHSDFFAELGARSRIRDLVRPLVGGEPVLIAVETFNKPARHGSGVPPHQDNAYFCQTPPDVLTVWVAVDAATAENGPVHYAPGTQARLDAHRASGIPGNSMVLVDPQMPEAGRVVVGTLAPGDALVHHCQTVHWSSANTTDAARCGLLLVYRAEHTRTDPELRRLYDEAQAEYRRASRT